MIRDPVSSEPLESGSSGEDVVSGGVTKEFSVGEDLSSALQVTFHSSSPQLSVNWSIDHREVSNNTPAGLTILKIILEICLSFVYDIMILSKIPSIVIVHPQISSKHSLA